MQITEVGKKYGLTPDTLRYYERVGLIPPVNRSSGGIRDYTEEDERWVDFITCMRSAGLPIDFLIEYVNLFRQGDKTKDIRKAMLVEQRDILAGKIETYKTTLEYLNLKIERYDTVLLVKERELGAVTEQS